MLSGFFLAILEYCSAVWCLAADTHLKLLDRVVWCPVTNWGCVSVCDSARCRSVAVLCMPYKVRCNLMHPLNGAVPGAYVPVWITCGALVAHRYNYARSRWTPGILYPSQCPSGTILLTPYSIVWDGRVSGAGPMLSYWPKLLYPYDSLLFFPFSSFCL